MEKRRRPTTSRLTAFANFSGRHRLASRLYAPTRNKKRRTGEAHANAASDAPIKLNPATTGDRTKDGAGASRVPTGTQPASTPRKQFVPEPEPSPTPVHSPKDTFPEQHRPAQVDAAHTEPASCSVFPLTEHENLPVLSHSPEASDIPGISTAGGAPPGPSIAREGSVQPAARTHAVVREHGTCHDMHVMSDKDVTDSEDMQAPTQAAISVPPVVRNESDVADRTVPDDSDDGGDTADEEVRTGRSVVQTIANDEVTAENIGAPVSTTPVMSFPDSTQVPTALGVFHDSDSDDADLENHNSLPDETDHACGAQPLVTLRTLRQRMVNVVDWSRLVSMLCMDGSIPFTETCYTTMVQVVAGCTRGPTLKGVRSVRRNISVNFMKFCYPTSVLVLACRNTRANPVTSTDEAVTLSDGSRTRPENAVRIVLPSAWAKMDIATLSTYRSIFERNPDDASSRVDIEYSPIVRRRTTTLFTHAHLKAQFRNKFCMSPADIGDMVSFPCSADPQLRSHSVKGWVTETDTGLGSSGRGVVVNGTVGPTVGVGFASEWNQPFEPGQQQKLPATYYEAERYLLELLKKPTAVWDGCNKNAAHSIQDDKLLVGSSSFKHSVIEAASTIRQATARSTRTTHHIDLFAGDTVTSLRPCDAQWSSRHVCLFVASPTSYAMRRVPERLIWVTVSRVQDREREIVTRRIANVTRVPYFTKSPAKWSALDDGDLRRRNVGTLDNGERFLVYRVALYADGFQQRKSTRQSKSVTGCYLLPLGLPDDERASPQAVRVITLGAHGQPVEDVLRTVLADLSEAARHGVHGIDPYGRKVRIFIDTVAFFGDMPQAAGFTDTLGHTSNALCTLCSMRRRKGTADPETNYSSETHGNRMCLARFNARREAIRLAQPHDKLLRKLGMLCHTGEDGRDRLAVSYCTSLNTAPPTERTPVPLLFDHARSIPAVPDHLLTGIIAYVTRACFDALPSDEDRRHVEMRIVTDALGNGLDVKRNILQWAKSKGTYKYMGTASNSMSAWFSILLISSAVFADVYIVSGNIVHALPQKLQRLCSILYKWPNAQVTGHGTRPLHFNKRKDQLQHEHEVADRARQFMESVRHVHREDPSIGKVMDKPVMHRLLELVTHTIPTYGHARMCSELVLEQTHQTFKTWLCNNTHSNVHISAVDRAIGKDWMRRVAVLFNIWKHGDAEDAEPAERGLRRMFLGEEALSMESDIHAVRVVFGELRDAMRVAMAVPVAEMLTACIPHNTTGSGSADYGWRVLYKSSTPCSRTVMLCMDNLIRHGHTTATLRTQLHCYERVRYMPKSALGRLRSYRHNVVAIGEAVSAIVGTSQTTPADGHGDFTITPRTDGRGSCKYYVIVAIISGAMEANTFAVVKQLDGGPGPRSCAHSPVQLILLNAGVRRVGLVHYCDDAFKVCTAQGKILHGVDVLGGGQYHVIDRQAGFPPFLG